MANSTTKPSFGEQLINTLAPVLTGLTAEHLGAIFTILGNKDKKALKTVLTSMYGPIDVHLEDLAKKSKTKIDDAAVQGILSAIELAAAEFEIELKNLDND